MTQLSKLRWQCRRGTKELDFLLLRYLDTRYALADADEQTLFVELLALEDDELIGVLLGDLEVEAEGMKALVEKIRVVGRAMVGRSPYHCPTRFQGQSSQSGDWELAKHSAKYAMLFRPYALPAKIKR